MAVVPEILGLSRILAPLFGGQEEEEIDPYDPLARMNSLYSPEHAASDRLTSMIDQMPVRNNPSMMQKIVASVAGLQGPEAAPQQEQIMYGDYNRKLYDWKERLNPAVQAASFERQGNTNERLLANQIVSNEQRDRTLGRQIKRDKVLEDQGSKRIAQGDKRLEQADERIAIAQAVAKGGTIDWGSSQIIYDDGTTVPIKADLFTTQEKMELQQKYAKERIKLNAENRPGNRDRVKTEVIDDPDKPGSKILVTINLDTNEVTRAKLTNAAGKKSDVTPTVRTEETQANKDREITARALSLKVQDPSGKYIIIKNGRFEGITRPGVLFGPNVEDYKKLFKKIYGTEPTDIPNAPPNVTTPQGRIKVRRKNPQTGVMEQGSIPAAQKQQAIEAGYEVLP